MLSTTKLSVRPPDATGSWYVNDRRYFENAHDLLAELELLVVEVNSQWPKLPSEAVKKEETTDAHWKLVRRRDLLSDSIKIFSAMSVEAFLNFYGVLRLGSIQFDKTFERLGPVPKLRKLFKLCDNIQLKNTDLVVVVVDKIAKRRNRQVHPETIDVTGGTSAAIPPLEKIPEVAREAVADMISFYQEIAKLQPDVAHHLPKPYVAGP